MFTRIFLSGIGLFLVGAVCGCRTPSPQAGYQVEEKTVAELSADMASGKVTSEGLVKLYLSPVSYTHLMLPTSDLV